LDFKNRYFRLLYRYLLSAGSYDNLFNFGNRIHAHAHAVHHPLCFTWIHASLHEITFNV
jgi:hypothetical protein